MHKDTGCQNAVRQHVALRRVLEAAGTEFPVPASEAAMTCHGAFDERRPEPSFAEQESSTICLSCIAHGCSDYRRSHTNPGT